MADSFWLAFFQMVSTAVLAFIGYISLRHKASAANVENLENRIAFLEREIKRCNDDREFLIKKVDLLSARLLETTRQVGDVKEEAAHATGLAAGLVQGATQGLDSNAMKGVIATKESDAFTKGYDQAIKDITANQAGKNRETDKT